MTRRRVPGDPKVAVAYLRASTDRQDLSPGVQRASIEKWASREGVVVVGWHEDQGVSGGAALEDGPGRLAAVDALDAHHAGILPKVSFASTTRVRPGGNEQDRV